MGSVLRCVRIPNNIDQEKSNAHKKNLRANVRSRLGVRD